MSEGLVTKLVSEHTFNVDPKFLALFPRAQTAMDNSLEKRVIEEGGNTNPATVWKEGNILIDGHRRRAACEKAGVPLTVRYRSFPSRYAAMTYCGREHDAMRLMRPHDLMMAHAEMVATLLETGSQKSVAVGQVATDLGKADRTIWRQFEAWESFRLMSVETQTAIVTGFLDIGLDHYKALAKLTPLLQAKVVKQAYNGEPMTSVIKTLRNLSEDEVINVDRSAKSGRVKFTKKPVEQKTESTSVDDKHSDTEDGTEEEPEESSRPDRNPWAWDDEYEDVDEEPEAKPVPKKPSTVKQEYERAIAEAERPAFTHNAGTREEILNRCKEAERCVGAAARSLDSLFGDGGLAAPTSAWRAKAMNLIREIGFVIRDVRDANEVRK